MAVEVNTAGPVLKHDVPKALFTTPIAATGISLYHRWDVSADGKRMIFDSQVGETASVPITVRLN